MHKRGDFSADSRLLPMSALAIVIGGVCCVLAVILLDLIAFFTNLFYFHRFSLEAVTIASSHPGWTAVLCPVVGGLLIGLMARFGSDKIRGHGIPEAMEAILFGRSRMEVRVALLKPLSSAISIGSGGPFGAEGPIIMTGGAFGSLIAQAFHLTSVERKTLLVAGAAGGMTAIFGTPVAAVLLAVELMLFEWKPRSVIPVALASVTAGALRSIAMGMGPLFLNHPHAPLSGPGVASATAVGLLAGALSILLTLSIYRWEDWFGHVRLHWMWWPALGGVVVGLGGLIEPRALGVGYDVIADLLNNPMTLHALVLLLVVKGFIWSVALGSGTSGGVLAPLLITGGALGAIEDHFLPGGGHGLWALVSMAAVFGGTMRSPLTSVVFALELTHDTNTLLPLLIASSLSYAVTVLTLKRSILTEKVARRGYHIQCEYGIDPLECVSVADVMTREVQSVSASMPMAEFGARTRHRGYPVVDLEGRLVGMVTLGDVMEASLEGEASRTIADIMQTEPLLAGADEICREAAERMAIHNIGRLPVLDETGKLVGIITRRDVMRTRARAVDEEQTREQFFRFSKASKRAPNQPEEQAAALAARSGTSEL